MPIKPWLMFGLIASLCGLADCNAAQPLSVYKGMQAKAPEVFEIEIVDLKAESKETTRTRSTDYRITAKVSKVLRTRSKVTPDDEIQISYTRTVRKPGFEVPSPAPNPAVSVSDRLPAYLKRAAKGTGFTLAAEAYSFKRIP